MIFLPIIGIDSGEGLSLLSEMQTCLDDLCVVKHHQGSTGQILRQGTEHVFSHLTVLVDEQLARVALRQRELCDALIGQVVAVISNMYSLWIQCFIFCF